MKMQDPQSFEQWIKEQHAANVRSSNGDFFWLGVCIVALIFALLLALAGCGSPPPPSEPYVINMGGIKDGWGVTATPKDHPRIMLHDGDRWVSSDDWAKFGPHKCEECHTRTLFYKKYEVV